MEYIPTIGLEIHAELKTKTKMFCGCLNDSEEKNPNVNICPVCLGHPGTLPIANKQAIESVVKLGLALGGKIAEDSHFDRKSYFYPDLPKAYQISQYDRPFVEHANLKGIKIKRIHLEEDTGRLLHNDNDYDNDNINSHGQKSSYVDFNRAGVPLMELVTEPDIKSAEEAVAFAKELQLILRYLEISDADMEKGQMRVEVNISLMSTNTVSTNSTNSSDSRILGTKVEVKNINSFKAVFGAINYEIKRQEEVLEAGEKVIHETRGWNDAGQKTVSQRFKEESHDYRYFPEPDLPPLDLREWDLEKMKMELPELPEEKRERFMKEFGLVSEQADILAQNKNMADYFEAAASELQTYNLEPITYNTLYNYLASDLRGLINDAGIAAEEIKIPAEHFAHLIFLIQSGKLSSRLAKDILLKMFETGEDPETIMNAEGLTKMSDSSELEEILKEVILENPNAVADFKKGKETALQFLIGKTMAKTKGKADPENLKELFKKIIG